MMTHQAGFIAIIAACLVASNPVIGIEVRKVTIIVLMLNDA